MELFDAIDPRLSKTLQAEWERRRASPHEPLPRGVTVALVGHRAAGKTSLLPAVEKLLGRAGVDLDAALAQHAQRDLRSWLSSDFEQFRAAERACFAALPSASLVACGGGFLSHHPDALAGCIAVEVPITFETYCERLEADVTRPRLLPALSIDEELREIWQTRESLHRRLQTMAWVDFLLAAAAGRRPRRVVTLPPMVDAVDFALRSRRAGAELLEVRTDLIPTDTDLRGAARVLPLLIAQRELPVPPAWVELAEVLDVETPRAGPRVLLSHHAAVPLTPDQAVALWKSAPNNTRVKHVEPLGPPAEGWRLLETQRRLKEQFGPESVTVLATGPLALPFRAVLARENALDYLALEPGFSAAAGQRLLADGVREARAGMPRRARLGIFGHEISGSKSPAIHPQPFDRIDLLADVDLSPLIDALQPHYRGFAITSPFKRSLREGRSINTLWRVATLGYDVDNTDVDGAKAALEKLGGSSFTVLGEGGVADALAAAAIDRAVQMRFIRRIDCKGQPISGSVIWTWPAELDAPAPLRLDGLRVGVISYGARGHRIGRRIRLLGGTPVWLGARWFIAQARAQREKWEEAT